MTVAIQPVCEGTEDGTALVGDEEGIVLGANEGAAVLNRTQNSINPALISNIKFQSPKKVVRLDQEMQKL